MNVKVLLIPFIFVATPSVFANETEQNPHPWELLVFGGIATLDANNSLIHVSDIQTDKITQTNNGDWDSWSVQVGLGYTFSLNDEEEESDDLQWFASMQPQLKVYYLKGNIDGHVDRFYQYDGNYSDTDYTSDFKSTRVMLDLALTILSYENFSLFGLAGVGPSWNHINYNTGVNEGAKLHLDDESQTNFAYEFGGGISYAVNGQLSVTAQYLFTGFNNISLNNNGTEGGDREVTVDAEDFTVNAQTVFLGLGFAF